MTNSSDIPEEFKSQFGLDENWSVRFTADKIRAHEMADQYKQLGYKVAVTPLQPDDANLNTEELQSFSEALNLEHDPLTYIQDDGCSTCLDDTYVVFTKEETESGDNGELLFE